MATQCALDVRNVTKVYGGRGKRTDVARTIALENVSMQVAPGEFVAIMGPSGSGKSTLLNCISTIDVPTSGQIVIGGRNVERLSRREVARFRRDELGFVFQDANLLDTLTAYENIALALTIKHVPAREVDVRVCELARTLGISDVLEKYPHQLSGGQRQRVAAARATVGDPTLILADEPTGALDSKSAKVLLETFSLLNQRGSTIVMVTHDSFTASCTERVVFIKDGHLWGHLERGGKDRKTFFADIVSVTTKLGGDQDDVL